MKKYQEQFSCGPSSGRLYDDDQMNKFTKCLQTDIIVNDGNSQHI